MTLLSWFNKDEFKSLPEMEQEYRGMLAAVAYAIDARADAREVSELEQFRKSAPSAFALLGENGKLIEGVSFSQIQRRHRAHTWSKAKLEGLVQWVRQRVVVDGEVAPEEMAFLAQLGQIFKEGERVPLFLAAESGMTARDHDFFDYLSERQFREEFPNSRCNFTRGALYTYHPFLSAALVPFSEEGLQVAQLETLSGVVALARELGAKRATIRHDKNFSAAIGASGNMALTEPNGAGSLSIQRSVSGEVVKNDGEVLICEFEGRIPVYARWLPWFWKRRLLKQHAGCGKYLDIIEARLSANPEKSRTHKITSERSAKLAAALSFAIKAEGADMGAGGEGKLSMVAALNEELILEF
jgi:hypothetical protein